MPLSRLFQTLSFLFFMLLSYSNQAQNESFQMTQIGSNFLLDKAWDLHYGPDEYLWVTEREAGKVVRVNPETAERDELIDIPDVYSDASQDGLLGIALHNGILSDNPYVYLSYTYLLQGERRQKLVRYTYTINGDDGSLSSPVILIDSLPSSNDHNSGRLVYGPDGKLYYTIGDQGGNQNRNFCNPILSQVLPSQSEIDQRDWTHYPGKILRLNVDGSIPDNNPLFDGVRSHIYSYGHRNAQGIVFSKSGLLYADEHGPNTDDEVNIIYAGGNYGWPNVVGFQDDQAYDYCNWSSAPDCQSLSYSNGSCPPNATLLEESSFMDTNYQEPLVSMFAVPDNYDYNNPDCSDSWICRPNVAPSSIGIYERNAIPGWNKSLLVTSLKRGRVYRLQLDEFGTSVIGDTTQYFYTPNRYRDIAVDPDGRSFYLITDESGRTSDASGLNRVNNLQNPGALLKFTYQETVAVQNQETDTWFKVWPNPSSDRIYIDLKQPIGTAFKLALINTSGKVVKEFRDVQTGVNEINMDDFPSGIYFLRLSSKDASWQKRVILF